MLGNENEPSQKALSIIIKSKLINTKRILREITTKAITNAQHATQKYEYGRSGHFSIESIRPARIKIKIREHNHPQLRD
jgi:hypothetical protein